MTRPKSFVIGSDSDVLNTLIPLHAPARQALLLILDVTYGNGTMWKGTAYQPFRHDQDPARGLDQVGDFRDLSWSAPGAWDLIVFDPPHITDAGARSALLSRYSTVKGHNITPLFEPFLRAAQRVLKPDGVILAKISDQVHAQRHQWQLVDFVNAVRSVGMIPCDLMVKASPSAGGLRGLWKRVLHTRNAHCYWIVVRQGKHCYRKAAA